MKTAGISALRLRPLSVAFVGIALAMSMRAESRWTPLLDRELSQWRSYLSFVPPTDYNGAAPVDESGNPIEPIGYDVDPHRVFTVLEMDGELALRVSGEVYGCVFTKEMYSNYWLTLRVKWGEDKWTPRADKLRDSGILYHSQGEAGADYWRTWMLSQEFQIMEGHMGDYWNIAQSAIDIRAFQPEGAMNAVASPLQPFLPFGAGPSIAGFCLRSNDYESAPGEWTTLELICFEDKSIHVVNGEVVMISKNSRSIEDGEARPLVAGRIQLQSEGAETYFSDIRIRSIDSLPERFQRYYVEQ